MKITRTKLNGVYIIEPDVFTDSRGLFLKPFSKEVFSKYNLVNNFEENFYSKSNKGVIRGMHFQTPPMDHAKLIYVTNGSILDVILDIRKGSPSYGEYITVELSDKNHNMIYIPKGCAHGFLSLENDSCTVYLQETARSAQHESGIRSDSFGMDWGIENPILSDRDKEFSKLEDFDSPFTFIEHTQNENIN
jgi:dTDP-4-dehydrorhamnose 3,5-epimerase